MVSILRSHCPVSPSATKGWTQLRNHVCPTWCQPTCPSGLPPRLGAKKGLCSPVWYLPGTPWFRLLGTPGPLWAEAPFPFQDGLYHSYGQRWGGCHAEVTLVWGQGQPGLAIPPWTGWLFFEQRQALLPVPEKSFNQTLTLTSPPAPAPTAPGLPQPLPSGPLWDVAVVPVALTSRRYWRVTAWVLQGMVHLLGCQR